MSQYVFEIDGNYVNFNGGGNLWRLHKDSNCVSWHWDESGDLFFDVYDQEYVVKSENIGEVVVGGVTLTTAADFETNIKIVFPGLGSSYLVATKTLTNDEIKTLPTAPVEILSAPGVGKMYAVLQAVLNWDFTAGAYTVSADSSWQLLLADSLVGMSIVQPALSPLSNAVKGMLQLSAPYMQTDGSPTFSPSVVGQPTVNLGAIPVENKALLLGDIWGGVSNYTGGNASNTLKITVFYTIIDL